MIANSAGQRLGEQDFDAFGKGGTLGAGSLQFTAHERDWAFSPSDETLDYMHARYAVSGGGRFLSVDPILKTMTAARSPQAWHRYAYARSNPLARIDPDGRADHRTPLDLAILEDPDVLEVVSMIVERTGFNLPVQQRAEHGTIVTDLGSGGYGITGIVTSGSPIKVDFTIARSGTHTVTGQRIAGVIHSHPGPITVNGQNYGANSTSSGDQGVAQLTQAPVYALNEKISLIKYDPAVGQDVTILDQADFAQCLARADAVRAVRQMPLIIPRLP